MHYLFVLFNFNAFDLWLFIDFILCSDCVVHFLFFIFHLSHKIFLCWITMIHWNTETIMHSANTRILHFCNCMNGNGNDISTHLHDTDHRILTGAWATYQNQQQTAPLIVCTQAIWKSIFNRKCKKCIDMN